MLIAMNSPVEFNNYFNFSVYGRKHRNSLMSAQTSFTLWFNYSLTCTALNGLREVNFTPHGKRDGGTSSHFSLASERNKNLRVRGVGTRQITP